MEEAIQEVDSVSSQNAVDETQSEDGNISMAEYASSLLKAQSEEEEPSEQPEEESESAEEEAAATAAGEAQLAETEAAKVAEEKQVADKASGDAKLKALGLTDDEIAAR